MRNSIIRIFGAVVVSMALITACEEAESKKEKALVYEGMSSEELKSVLGEPLSIDSKGEIFDANTMKKMSVQAWSYQKRVVLLINDTVKNPNINSGESN
jgi:hypothetical protein